MKKTYLNPSIEVEHAQAEQMLASSGVISNNNDINISYGGVDSDGGQNPSVKESNSDYVWDF